jgi:hypothetical protein
LIFISGIRVRKFVFCVNEILPVCYNLIYSSHGDKVVCNEIKWQAMKFEKRDNMDDRKLFSKFYFVVLICLLILPCSAKTVNGEDWKLYFEGDNGMLYYYDAESIKFLTPNIAHVWMKNFPPTEEVRLNYIQTLRKKEPTFPDNVKYTNALAEINCKSKTYTCLQLKAYSVKDEVVISETIKDPPIETVQPESMVNTLQKVVCARKDVRKKRR